ncbi:MAG: hypothetical protein ACRYFX_18950 [Janthinobacterium lividum]
MREALFAEGFKQFEQRCLGHENAVANYQKCFRNSNGKRYYITVFEHDMSLIPGFPRHIPPISFEFTAQLHQGSRDGQTVNIEASAKEAADLPAMLEMFESIFMALGGVYYEQY